MEKTCQVLNLLNGKHIFDISKIKLKSLEINVELLIGQW